jgi:hypothetical protein
LFTVARRPESKKQQANKRNHANLNQDFREVGKGGCEDKLEVCPDCRDEGVGRLRQLHADSIDSVAVRLAESVLA